VPPVGANGFEKCEPVYIELPGWPESTIGTQSLDELPPNARNYLRKIEELCGAPVDVVSTGPDRTQTVVLRHPFGI